VLPDAGDLQIRYNSEPVPFATNSTIGRAINKKAQLLICLTAVDVTYLMDIVGILEDSIIIRAPFLLSSLSFSSSFMTSPR
jgi:hypothetical protein